MRIFIIKRLLLGVLVLFGVISVTFVIVRIIPSDPAAQWVGPRATLEQIEAARVELGLNDSFFVQYTSFVADLMQGNLGKSIRTHQPVLNELKAFLPATLELVFLSTFIGVFLGLYLGVLSAKRKDQWVDHLCRFFSVATVSIPSFWIGLLLQSVFYGSLDLLPLGERLSMNVKLFHEIPDITGMLLFDSLITGNFVVFWDALKHIILPGFVMALFPIGLVARMTRSALLEILSEDYIIAARSYGLSERIIMWSYALKNSLGPTATVVTLAIGYTLVNTFLVESIFSWPGIGNYIASAIVSLDYPAIMGVTIFSAVSYVFLNLVADMVIALDPRVRI
ncbi:MAG: ABC transporter permease [Deltaproteobacteria bacterium]|nr:ABC transporter permease [Deltaproteobacteria bacterium]